MPQSLSRIVIHTVFSTQEENPRCRIPPFEKRFTPTSEVRQDLGLSPLRIGGVADHVHLLTTLARTMAVADFVKEVKRVSTNWIQERGGLFRQFHWQAGYATFSVSESQVPAVMRYIENQEAHHRRVTFQDEFREFLRRHRQEWDERYVWD